MMLKKREKSSLIKKKINKELKKVEVIWRKMYLRAGKEKQSPVIGCTTPAPTPAWQPDQAIWLWRVATTFGTAGKNKTNKMILQITKWYCLPCGPSLYGHQILEICTRGDNQDKSSSSVFPPSTVGCVSLAADWPETFGSCVHRSWSRGTWP